MPKSKLVRASTGFLRQGTVFMSQGTQYGRGYTMTLNNVLDFSDPFKGTLSNLSVSVGFFNAVLGSGILLFPKLSYQAGIPLITILMILSAGLLWGSGILLAKSSELSNTCSFHKLMITALKSYWSDSPKSESKDRLSDRKKTIHPICSVIAQEPPGLNEFSLGTISENKLPNMNLGSRLVGVSTVRSAGEKFPLPNATVRAFSEISGKSKVPDDISELEGSSKFKDFEELELAQLRDSVRKQPQPNFYSKLKAGSPLKTERSTIRVSRISMLSVSPPSVDGSYDTDVKCRCLAMLLEIFVFLDCFITVVSYMQCLGEYGLATYKGLKEKEEDEKNIREYFRFGSGILATFLSLIAGSKLQNMVWMNFVGSIAIMYAIIYTISSPAWNGEPDIEHNLDDEINEDLWNFFPRKTGSPVKVFVTVFSTMGYAFPNYFCSARYYSESSKKESFARVVGLTYVFIVVIYGAYGFIGANLPKAQTFLEWNFNSPDSAIFPNYYNGWVYDEFALTLVFLAMFCTIISVLPVYIMELSQCFQTIVIQLNIVSAKSYGWWAEQLTKVVMGLLTTVLATFITRLETVIEIDGALILTPLGYFFPPIIYLMLVHNKKKKDGFWVSVAWIVLFSGVIFFVISWYIFFSG